MDEKVLILVEESINLKLDIVAPSNARQSGSDQSSCFGSGRSARSRKLSRGHNLDPGPGESRGSFEEGWTCHFFFNSVIPIYLPEMLYRTLPTMR